MPSLSFWRKTPDTHGRMPSAGHVEPIRRRARDTVLRSAGAAAQRCDADAPPVCGSEPRDREEAPATRASSAEETLQTHVGHTARQCARAGAGWSAADGCSVACGGRAPIQSSRQSTKITRDYKVQNAISLKVSVRPGGAKNGKIMSRWTFPRAMI